MYFNESLNQANSRNEFHRVGEQKTVERREGGFPWRKYKVHYIWKQVLPGGWALVYHKHPTASIKTVGHYECDWIWIGNTYPWPS